MEKDKDKAHDTDKDCYIVDSDLHNADEIIDQLDQVIQVTRNLKLSKTLNDISDSVESIRALLNRKNNN
jgi:hypothetical protein